MIVNSLKSFTIVLMLSLAWSVEAQERGLLDGRVFSGLIGPSENPDLSDTLYFNDGHFWSEICVRCGFAPGVYVSREVEDGIEFSGILESKSRGRFDYNGTVGINGNVTVSIKWERRRWYWSSSREIIFIGQASELLQSSSLSEISKQLEASNPDENPLCARF